MLKSTEKWKCDDITLKHGSHEKHLGVIIDNELSSDKHIINKRKKANKKLNALSRINHCMKQNQKEMLLSSFIISHFSYLSLICMFCSNRSTKRKNTVHDRSLRILLNG